MNAYGVVAPEGPSGGARPGRVTLDGTPSVGGAGVLDPADAATKVRRALPAVRACYQEALRDDPGLVGTLGFEVTVTEAGAVRVSVRQDDAGLAGAGVTACVVSRMSQTSFADHPPQGGEVRVLFQVRFGP